MSWSAANIPNLAGKLAVVTGGTGGLGFETALALAKAGARVIIAARNPAKGEAAVRAVRQAQAAADVAFRLCDLSSLESVRQFADDLLGAEQRVDLLINNAGIMAVPRRRETTDGFELQFGTNYLGHFALTGRLLPALQGGHGARVVYVASLAHRRGRIDFADPQGKAYGAWKAYSQSKLAMLMGAIGFQRRSAALGWGVIGVAAHPGWAQTDIFTNGPGLGGPVGWKERLGKLVFPIFGQSAAAGALPILYAATAPGVQAGGYYGPDGFYELKGAPAPARIEPQALDVDAASKLWALSVHLTGVDPALMAEGQSSAGRSGLQA